MSRVEKHFVVLPSSCLIFLGGSAVAFLKVQNHYPT